jgi:hypothetical protein
MTDEELTKIRDEILLEDCSGKEKEMRKKLEDTFLQLMDYVGFIQITSEESPEGSEFEESKMLKYSKHLKWKFPFSDYLNPARNDLYFEEAQYFEERKKVCQYLHFKTKPS